MTPGKKRQAEFRARMLAEGRRQYAFWLTPEQAEEIRVYLAGKQSRLTPAQSEKVPRLELGARQGAPGQGGTVKARSAQRVPGHARQ